VLLKRRADHRSNEMQSATSNSHRPKMLSTILTAAYVCVCACAVSAAQQPAAKPAEAGKPATASKPAATDASSPTTAVQTFDTPKSAADALVKAARDFDQVALIRIFGPDGRDIVFSGEFPQDRKHAADFAHAAEEKLEVSVDPNTATRAFVLIGNEDWPFPVPIVQDAGAWRFDTAAGKEEVLARRIGRNELAAMFVCRAYVSAQKLYAARPHDGQPVGRYATKFKSDPGKQNGLYWPVALGEKRSPLGDLVARAAEEGQSLGQGQGPTPFHGYYFRILPADGGFGLVAWPAQYDATGVMTFVVNQDGTVREKDLGPDTDRTARAMTAYAPDASWTPAVAPHGE
jgi:Protein of unknown function (DUF2950)